MKRRHIAFAIASVILAVCGGVAASRYYKRERAERLHFERGETELIVTNLARVPLRLYKAGKALRDAQPVASSDGDRIWLQVIGTGPRRFRPYGRPRIELSDPQS